MNELAKPLRCTTQCKVPFYDVDQMRVAWHGSYFKYLERARCDLLDLIHYGYREMEKSGYAWPVIDARIKYIKPMLFDAKVSIDAELVEYENRLKMTYVIRDAATGTILTRAHTVQVAVAITTGEMCFVSPPALLEKMRCHGYLPA